MLKRVTTYSVLALLLVTACSSSKQVPVTDPSEIPVESWDLVEVEGFNARIDEAVNAGETWPRDPIIVTSEFIWGGLSAHYTRLEKQDNRVEGADSTVIVIVRDRFLDDSIRGDWHRITLYRLSDMTWRLAEARRAFRCYRGRQLDSFGSSLCL
jgi:hypothetical protein